MRTARAFLLVLFSAGVCAAGGVRFETGNGIRVRIEESHAVPMVVFQVLVEAGSRLDPPGREGLANLTADLLNEGTKRRSAREVARTVDAWGARFSTGADKDYAWLRMTTLRRHAEEAFALLAESMLEPAFSGAEVERRKEVLLGSLRAEEDDPASVALRTFEHALHGAGPYGHPVEGWPGSVSALDRDDVEAFYRRWYRPERTIVVAVGDITREDVEALVERHFGSWPRAEGEGAEVREPESTEPRTIVVDKPTEQAHIVIGHRGVSRRAPEFEALLVLNQILGGGAFSSRLFRSIRTEAGLAYAVYSELVSRKLGGSFRVVLQTKPSSVEEAIRTTKHELLEIRREGVSREELEDARRYLTGSFALRLDSNTELAGFLARSEFFGLGEDYVSRFVEKVNAVDRKLVAELAREFLHPESLFVVVVGPKDKIGEVGP